MASILGYRSTPEPAYEVLKKAAEYEVRKYPSQLRAIVDMAPQNGTGNAFRALAGYIFGGSVSKATGKPEPIEMTAPVAMSHQTGEKIEMTAPVAMTGTYMSFIMPSKYTRLDQLPDPKDPRVRLVEVPGCTYAVVRYSGLLSEAAAQQNESKLREAAKRDGLELSNNLGDVQVWGYDPPWTLPWCRRNEVAIPLTTPLAS